MTQHKTALEYTSGEVRAAIARGNRTALGMANDAQIRPGTMYRKLRGEHWFTLPELLSIADVLGVDVATFLPTNALRAGE